MCGELPPLRSPLEDFSSQLMMAGAFVSLVSIVTNTILLYSLISHPRCFRCYFHFLCILAMLDIVVSACYIPVIAVDQWKDALHSMFLARLWWNSFQYLLGLTHVAMTASSFILSGALMERFLITIRSRFLKKFQRRRTSLCVGSIVLAFFSKGLIMFELELVENDDKSCRNTVLEYVVDLSPLCHTVWYGTVYRFWLRNILTVFVPFALLFFVNIRTVQVLKEQLKKAKLSARRKFSVNFVGKKKVRAATCTLLLVCLTYLLSNLLNVFITAWEFVDFNSLKVRNNDFYMFSTDLVSILVVASCALRLPIYMFSNAELRRVLQRAICKQSKTTGALLKNASQLYALNFGNMLLKKNGEEKI